MRDARRLFSQHLGIDTRSLAAFRIIAGSIILVDVLLRSRNFSLYYTSDGIVPLSVAKDLTPRYAISLYYLSDQPSVVASLFVLTGVVAVLFIVGYRTRIVSIAAFGLVISLDHRNPLVLSEADTLLRHLLFWGMFLPLGERWSIDSLQRDAQPRTRVVGMGTALILLQMVVFYLVNGYHKYQSSQWFDGTAAAVMLRRDEKTLVLGELVRPLMPLVQIGSVGWFLLLIGAWSLVVARDRLRTGLVILFITGHLFLGVSFLIGLLSIISIAGVILFLPGGFWRDAHVAVRWLGADRFVFTEIVAPIGDVGQWLASRLPKPTLLTDRQHPFRRGVHRVTLVAIWITIGLVLAVLLVSQIAPVVTGLSADVSESPGVKDVVDNATVLWPIMTTSQSLGVAQSSWNLFGSAPPWDRYYVFPAETVGGRRFDVYNNRSLSFERPYRQLQRQYDTYREHFFMSALLVRTGVQDDDRLSHALAEHFCGIWPQRYGSHISHLNMYVVFERVAVDRAYDPSARETYTIEFYRHGCDGRQPKELVRSQGSVG